jgi:hypothetical protein
VIQLCILLWVPMHKACIYANSETQCSPGPYGFDVNLQVSVFLVRHGNRLTQSNQQSSQRCIDQIEVLAWASLRLLAHLGS